MKTYGSNEFRLRRARLARAVGDATILIPAGASQSRNFPAATYPFRASSHFLYLVGRSIEGAFLALERGEWTLFAEEHGRDHALWHGPTASLSDLSKALSLSVASLAKLNSRDWTSASTLPAMDAATQKSQSDLLGRPVVAGVIGSADRELALAMVDVRLKNDGAALREIRAAVEGTVAAFHAGMTQTRPGMREYQVRGTMDAALAEFGMGTSYNPIVTAHGEVLHNDTYTGVLKTGDMLLCDYGAESPGGWAADVTRCWPVGQGFSTTQRDIYEVVLAAEKKAISACAAGTRYRDVHLAAATQLAVGLVELGLLSGDPAELVADGVIALFFPHGVGHLLGLDVHDMEDLGDLAGYAPGWARSPQFGLSYLRMDRELEPGMVVTVEPGIYFVPALLADESLKAKAAGRLNESVVARYLDVRGIRIEDDVLITRAGQVPDVLTRAIPKDVDQVQALLGSGA